MSGWTVRRRLMVAAAAITASGAVLLALAAWGLLALSLQRDATNTLDLRAAAALSTVTVTGGEVKVLEGSGDALLDANVWVYSGLTPIEVPPASVAVQAAAKSLVGVQVTTRLEVPDAEVALQAEPIRSRDSTNAPVVGTVIVSLSTTPYRTAAISAALWLGMALAVVLVGVTILSSLLVRAALRPVSVMTAQAARWSERDPQGRFDAGPPRDELTALASTLDSMLDRLWAMVAFDRRLSAELAHELRTPLAVLRTEVEITSRGDQNVDELRDFVGSVGEQTNRMELIVLTLLNAAESELDPRANTADLAESVQVAVESLSLPASDISVRVIRSTQPGLLVVADPALIAQILKPLLENAVHHARSSVAVEIERDDIGPMVSISDDGSGLPDDVALGELFLPGVRGNNPERTGAGLGLALSLRLARSVSGDVVAERTPRGARFIVRLQEGR